MKKLYYLIAMVLSLGLFGFTSSAQADVSTTVHNIGGNVCASCHVPHNSTSTLAPLWARADSTVTTYTMYSSDTLDGAIGTAPGDVSKACLSCHDGTVAYTGTTFMSGTKKIGDATSPDGTANNIANNHPINVTYGTDTALVALASMSLPLYGVDKVECATCHNPHDNTNLKFLRVSNVGSALCTTCHVK